MTALLEYIIPVIVRSSTPPIVSHVPFVAYV